jgi:hypothetical protein
MKFFWKLNIVSSLFAFVLFVSIELQVNFYRIWRLTGWEGNTVNIGIFAIHFVGLILSTILFYFLIKKWLEGKKESYWSIILWFPYLILLLFLFSYMFPITNRGEKPAPVSGLIIIGQLFIYPLYLLLIIYFVQPQFLF